MFQPDALTMNYIRAFVARFDDMNNRLKSIDKTLGKIAAAIDKPTRVTFDEHAAEAIRVVDDK